MSPWPILSRPQSMPAPFSAPVIACWISTFWIGMEFADLLGSKEAQAEHRAALDAIQKLLEQLDARVGQGAARRRKSRRKK